MVKLIDRFCHFFLFRPITSKYRCIECVPNKGKSMQKGTSKEY